MLKIVKKILKDFHEKLKLLKANKTRIKKLLIFIFAFAIF
jgi:hypothetical protein